MAGAQVGSSAAAPAPGRVGMADSAHVARMRRQAKKRHRFGRVGLYLLALGAAFVAALPFIWGTITAFKRDADLYNSENNPFVFNLDPTGEHVSFLFDETSFLTFAGNTLWVGLAVVALPMKIDRGSGGPLRIMAVLRP